MPDRPYRVLVTDSFLERLGSVESFLTAAGAGSAHDELLAELSQTVIPDLRSFPGLGRRYLDRPPGSAEAFSQLSRLPRKAVDTLREYPHGDYLILYTVSGSTVYLLSIRHHRELSYDFSRLWPGPGIAWSGSEPDAS